MILLFLGILIIALVLGNVLLSLLKKKTPQTAFQETSQEETTTTRNTSPNTSSTQDTPAVAEQYALLQGGVRALGNKFDIMNERVTTLERTTASIIEQKLETIQAVQAQSSANQNDSSAHADFEKLDFRIKVLEQDIDKVKEAQSRTIPTYRNKKLDAPLADKVRSLAFNAKR